MSTTVVIIGAYGSAGVAAAETIAEEPDVELILVDDGDPGGGLCILRGCMPSKEVLSAAEHRASARLDHRLAGPAPIVDAEAVVATKNAHVADFAAHRRAAVDRLAEREHVTFYHDSATFVDDRTIQVGNQTLSADYVVIATGSVVNVPDTPGIDTVDPMTSTHVLDATTFPDTGIVMGFGYVGLELVPYLSEVGEMELTVIEHDDRPLDEADAVFGDTILERYRADFGVEILTNAVERSIEPTDDGGVRLTVEQSGTEIVREADQLFAFTGRRPNLDGLGLEATQLVPERGWVQDTLQSRDDPQVFVVGDANGIEQILHVAKEQGYLAGKNVLAHAAGEPLASHQPTPHHVVFTGLASYPYARVGHTPATAAAADLDALTVRRSATADGVFKTKDKPYGEACLVVGGDGTVLGYQGIHLHADVMAKTMQVIVELGLDVRKLPDRAYHPTTPEILDGLFREAVQRLEAT